MRYIVVREASGHTAKKVLWQVLSREFVTLLDAEGWANFQRKEYKHLKGDTFVVAVGCEVYSPSAISHQLNLAYDLAKSKGIDTSAISSAETLADQIEKELRNENNSDMQRI